jgi:hypothetical protein
LGSILQKQVNGRRPDRKAIERGRAMNMFSERGEDCFGLRRRTLAGKQTLIVSFAILVGTLLISLHPAFAQQQGTGARILISCEKACDVSVDGVSAGRVEGAKVVQVIPGEHLVVATSEGRTWRRVISVERDRQVVADVSFDMSPGAGTGVASRGTTAVERTPERPDSGPAAGSAAVVGKLPGWLEDESEWEWESETRERRSFQRVSCPVNVGKHIFMAFLEDYPDGHGFILYSLWETDVFDSRERDACLDFEHDVDSSAVWSIRLGPESGGTVSFKGVPQDMVEGWPQDMPRSISGSIQRISGSEISVTLVEGLQGTFRLKKE